MKAMILAAGFGKRMRPLTDHCPKPLLKVNDKALIEYHIEELAAAGFNELVINHAYLGEQIEHYLGDGSRYGVNINYSPETEPLETAGGIAKALPLLGDEPFLVVNGDVWIDYDFKQLILNDVKLGHLVLVSNPEHNPTGDFVLAANSIAMKTANETAFTFAGLSVLHPQLFKNAEGKDLSGKIKLLDVLLPAIQDGLISGELFNGDWVDVGTPERLQALDERIRSI